MILSMGPSELLPARGIARPHRGVKAPQTGPFRMWKPALIALFPIGLALVLNLILIEHGHSFSGAPTLLPVVVTRSDAPLVTIQDAHAESACVQVGGCAATVASAEYVEGLYARDGVGRGAALWGGLVLPAALALAALAYLFVSLRRART